MGQAPREFTFVSKLTYLGIYIQIHSQFENNHKNKKYELKAEVDRQQLAVNVIHFKNFLG